MVTHNEGAHRFESGQAHLDYRKSGTTMVITHTEVPEAMKGQGAGAELARAALQFARDSGLAVDPRCPFVATYIERHPEYADLVHRS